MSLSMIDTLRDFVRKAGELGVEYMVTGSFAMSAYGEIRTTRDIDIVVELRLSGISSFAEVFARDDYYVSESSARRAVEHRAMFNIVNINSGNKIDLIIRKDTEFGRVSFSRRRKAVVSGVEFWTSTKEDLILAKLNWAKDSRSELQIRDIANLTSDEYDAKYVADWVHRLCLGEIWSEVQTWKTLHQRSES